MIDLSSHRRLGRTHVMLGPLGLGTAPLGNLYEAVTDADVEATLETAERHGIRWFDTAPLYGHGLAEERLGRYLRRSPGLQRVLSTKVGRVLEPVTTAPTHAQFVAPLPNQAVFDYSRAGIQRSYEDSLRRLGVERVQILLLHDVDRLTHPVGHRALVKQLLDETLPALNRLQEEGCIDAIGLGVNEWDIGFEILASADIDCVLLAGRFTLLDHTALLSGFLDTCRRKHVAVLAGGVFNSGFLAGGSYYDYRLADESLMGRRDHLAATCERYGVSLPAAALQFAAAHPAITSVVLGARSSLEINAIAEWSRTAVPAQMWHELRHEGLIPADAPTPN